MSMFSNWMGSGSGPAQTKPNQTNPAQSAGNSPVNQNNSQQNNGNGSGQSNGASGQNGTSNDGPSIDTIWQSTTQQDNSQQNNQQNNQQQNNNANAQTPEEQIQSYLKQQGLEPITLSEADQEALRAGNFEGVMSRINNNITTAHISAVKAANQLIKAEVAKAVKAATTESRNYIDGLDVRKALQADPDLKSIAADPIFGPNVEAIFSQFLGKPNSNRELALKATKKYFQTMLQKFDPNAQVNNNRGGNYRTPQNSGDIDFLAMLRGQE